MYIYPHIIYIYIGQQSPIYVCMCLCVCVCVSVCLSVCVCVRDGLASEACLARCADRGTRGVSGACCHTHGDTRPHAAATHRPYTALWAGFWRPGPHPRMARMGDRQATRRSRPVTRGQLDAADSPKTRPTRIRGPGPWFHPRRLALRAARAKADSGWTAGRVRVEPGMAGRPGHGAIARSPHGDRDPRD